MKKYISLTTALLFAISVFSAGKLDLQLKAYLGGNVGIYKYKLEEAYYEATAGYQGGFSFRINKKKQFYEIGIGFTRDYLFLEDSFALLISTSFDPPLEKPRLVLTGFELPVVVGYKFVKTPKFKWHVYGGVKMATYIRTWVLDERTRVEKFKTKELFFSPIKFDLRLGTGIDIAFLNIDFDYDLGLNNAGTEVFRIQTHRWNLKFGVLF